MNPLLSVALIGAGQIAGGYDRSPGEQEERAIYTHAGAYAKNGNFSLRTVCDLDEQRIREFQAHWGFAEGVRDSLDLCRSFHDVISVCTPDATHHAIIKSLLESKCCKCIFVEKPVALTLDHIREIDELSNRSGIAVVVNYQRRFDAVLAGMREKLSSPSMALLAGSGYYIKGLDHIGTTMVDTVAYLLGYPQAVLAYNKTYNRQVNEDTYEFILFYENFNLTIKSVDSREFEYSYHVFELDLLTREGRICFNDNFRQIEIRRPGNYVYVGVRVLDDRHPERVETEYELSMLNAVAYLRDVATGSCPHTVNTLQSAYNNKLIVDRIRQSYSSQSTLEFKRNEWKR